MDSKFCAFFQYNKEIDGVSRTLINALGVVEELASAKELCWQHREKTANGPDSYYIAEYQDCDWSSSNASTLNKINTYPL